MTKIVFVAATPREMAAIEPIAAKGYHCVVSGVGATATAIATMSAIACYEPDMVVQVGIAGAVDRGLSIGQVVVVGSDFEADLGAWRAEERKFVKFDSTVYHSDFVAQGLIRVCARTVTTACTPLVEAREQIETMEGAAFFAAAQACGVNAAQIRSISNYVGDPRSEWKIDEAIAALEKEILKIF